MEILTSRLLKVVVVGDGAVGKTSLIRQYCEGKFDNSRVATIGVDFQTKTVTLPQGVVKLSIWDMAGQSHFRSVREGFYRGSRAAALVYDVTSEESLRHLVAWRQEVLNAIPRQPLLVIGNKMDLPHGRVLEYGKTLAQRIGAQHIETSAFTGQGVPQMFEWMAYLALGFHPPAPPAPQG